MTDNNKIQASLTEQWKKGELPAGRYWIKYRSGRIDDWDLFGGKTIESKPEIVEVLAPMPSYEEWKAKLEENTKLKELLKECRYIMGIEKEFSSCHVEKDKLCKLLTKINRTLGEDK